MASNSNIIPQGLTETVNGITMLAAADTPIELLMAETDLNISAITYMFPPKTANPGAISGFTLKAGRYLFNIKAITFTGIGTIIYRYKALP